MSAFRRKYIFLALLLQPKRIFCALNTLKIGSLVGNKVIDSRHLSSVEDVRRFVKGRIHFDVTKRNVWYVAPTRRFFSTTSIGLVIDRPDPSMEAIHDVNGILCREVDIHLQQVGVVTILEATAESQDKLVNIALSVEVNSDLKLHAGDPYGSVLWPAASAVADHLLTTVAKERSLENLTVLECGTGTGLISLAAALGGASRVIATDYEDLPLQILEYAVKVNCMKQNMENKRNNQISDKLSRIETMLFDICASGNPLPKANIMLAADIMYESKTGRALAQRVVEALNSGTRVIIGCSPGRPGRSAFIDELTKLMPKLKFEFTETTGTTCSGPRHELICGKDSTSVSNVPKRLSVALLDIDPKHVLLDSS